MKLANEQQLNIINDLIVKSINDSKFKEEFINNPKKVIETSYEFKVYDDLQIIAEDQSDENIIFLNIPHKPVLDEMELNEEELEAVAGGVTPILAGIAACALYDFGCGVIDSFR